MSDLLQNNEEYLEDESFVVIGEKSPYNEKLSKLKGTHKNYPHWIFPSSSKTQVQKYIDWVNNKQDSFPISTTKNTNRNTIKMLALKSQLEYENTLVDKKKEEDTCEEGIKKKNNQDIETLSNLILELLKAKDELKIEKDKCEEILSKDNKKLDIENILQPNLVISNPNKDKVHQGWKYYSIGATVGAVVLAAFLSKK